MPADAKSDQTDTLLQLEQLTAAKTKLEGDLVTATGRIAQLDAQLKQVNENYARQSEQITAANGQVATLTRERDELKLKQADFDKAVAAEVARKGVAATAVTAPETSGKGGKLTWTEKAKAALAGAKVASAAAVVLLTLFIAPRAQAQNLARDFRSQTLSTFPTSVAASTTTTLTSSNVVFAVVSGSGVGLQLKFTGSGADTANVIVKLGVSLNGSTVSTENYVTWQVAATGTTPVIAFTNIPPTYLDNVPYLAVRSVQNANTNSITNVTLTAISAKPPK